MDTRTVTGAMIEALSPAMTEILATGLSLALGAVLMAARRYAGLKAEALMRDALTQAIKTGIAQADPAKGSAATQAVQYAKRSSPGAIKALGATDDILFDKARAAAADRWE